jgi:hypothetical protein
MKNHLLRNVSVLSLLIFSVAQADTVTDWNSAALEAIRANHSSPPVASRNLAMLHAAIFDSVNGITRTYQPYFVSGHVSPSASVQAAASAGAYTILAAEYPSQQPQFAALYSASVANIANSPHKRAGTTWGENVANTILASRASDGSTNIISYTPGTNAGDWVPTPPAFAPALLPQWGSVKPFAMASGSQFRPPPPPSLTSTQYTLDFGLTKSLGGITNSLRTLDQTEIALFWADGAGTATPPGHWNEIAQGIAAAHGNTLEQNARLFALLNIALADSAIACWDAKFTYNRWRPVTAIAEADLDGNPDTDADPNWLPLLITPPFPEYTSGHSTFSGAAAAVLGGFYGTDTLSFTSGSDTLPNVTRSFSNLSSAAEEAGISRIYGGIHFMTANQNGLQLGVQIGGYVVQNFMVAKKSKGK